MSPARRMRIALVGCGAWGRHILRDLLALGCEVPVVARSSATAARATQGGATVVVGRCEELGAIDGAVVAVPTERHYEIVRDLVVARPGVPVFTEKPLCTSSRDAEELVGLAPSTVFVMDKWRYHPGVLELASIRRSGELGPAVGLQTKRLGWGLQYADSNAVWHLAPHDLTIALEVLGTLPEPVAARLDVTAGRVRGMTAMLGHDPWTTIEVSERFGRHQREVRLLCRDGVAVLSDAYADAVEILRTEGRSARAPTAPERRTLSAELPLFAELAAFVRFVAGEGPPPKSSVQEGARVVVALERLFALAGAPQP